MSKNIFYIILALLIILSFFLTLWSLQMKSEIDRLNTELQFSELVRKSNEVVYENCNKEKTTKLLLIINYLEDKIRVLNDSIPTLEEDMKGTIEKYYIEFNEKRYNQKFDTL